MFFSQHISHLFQRARFNNLFTTSIAVFNSKNPEEKKKKRLHIHLFLTHTAFYSLKNHFFFRQYIKEQIKININDAYCERNIALVQEDGYKTVDFSMAQDINQSIISLLTY